MESQGSCFFTSLRSQTLVWSQTGGKASHSPFHLAGRCYRHFVIIFVTCIFNVYVSLNVLHCAHVNAGVLHILVSFCYHAVKISKAEFERQLDGDM